MGLNFLQRFGMWLQNMQENLADQWVEEQERINPEVAKYTREIQRIGREIHASNDARAARDPAFKATRDRLRAENGITQDDVDVAINRGKKSVR